MPVDDDVNGPAATPVEEVKKGPAEIPPLGILEPYPAPEFFASKILSSAFDGDNLRLTFGAERFNHANSTVDHLVINSRIVMPIASIKVMIDLLQRQLDAVALNAAQRPEGAHYQ